MKWYRIEITTANKDATASIIKYQHVKQLTEEQLESLIRILKVEVGSDFSIF